MTLWCTQLCWKAKYGSCVNVYTINTDPDNEKHPGKTQHKPGIQRVKVPGDSDHELYCVTHRGRSISYEMLAAWNTKLSPQQQQIYQRGM